MIPPMSAAIGSISRSMHALRLELDQGQAKHLPLELELELELELDPGHDKHSTDLLELDPG